MSIAQQLTFVMNQFTLQRQFSTDCVFMMQRHYHMHQLATNRKRDSESEVTSTSQLITEMQKEQQERSEQIQQLQQAANNQVML
jgi:hypothetical protein